MTERADAWYQEVVQRAATPPWARRGLKLAALVIREIARDQVHVRAATLAYWSLVAIVPALVLAAAIVAPIGADQAVTVRAVLYRTLLAGAVETVGARLDEWLADVDFTKLGIVGVIAVVLTASRIFFSVEEAYNRLWNVRIRRGFVTRMVLFYAGITFVPLLVALGFHVTARVQGAVDVSWLRHAGPTLITAVAFVGAIKALPDTEVRWRPALVGGLASAALFEAAKVGFNAYTTVLGAGDVSAVIYGSLGLFPVFLVWLYLLWLIVLVGVELAYVTQRMDDLLAAEDRRIQGQRQGRHHPDALFAVQCLMVVVKNFVAGLGPTGEPVVTQTLESDPVHIATALETLEEARILASTGGGWLPAIPPDRITIREVILRYRALTRPTMAEGAAGSQIIDEMLGAPGTKLDATLDALVGGA